MAVLLLCGSAGAIRDPETGVEFPDQIQCDGTSARAAGAGVREATFGINVYAVALYVGPAVRQQSVRSTEGCVAIRARFVRNVDADKVRGAWIDGFRREGLSASNPQVKKFLGVVQGEMKKGGEMMMIMHKGKVIYSYMGRSVTIPDAPKLARAIKGIYLGPGSPTPTLVQDLTRRGYARR